VTLKVEEIWKWYRDQAIKKMEGENINPLKKRIIQSVSKSHLLKPKWVQASN
jgi:hypothetical protein